MPQLTTVVLKDTAAKDVTFVPAGIADGVAAWRKTNGVPLADFRMTYNQTRTTTGKVKETLKFVVPVVQDAAIGGISKPTVVRTAYAELNLTFDSSSTAVERSDAIAFVHHCISAGQPDLPKAFVGLEGIY